MLNLTGNRNNCQAGFSIIEVLVAAAITSVVALAAFQFYISMHNQVITQQEISDMQQNSRACLQEISKTLRKGGYMLDGDPGYEINGDSLYVFYSDAPPAVDSVLYFLQEFSDEDYARVVGTVSGMTLYKLMRQENSNTATPFSEYVTDIQFTPISGSSVAISIWVQASKTDETFPDNNGFRIFTNTERVNLRNAVL